MGRYDLVPKALETLGVRLVFHRIAQRPGKPMWFGITDGGPAVFALPGNPVSTLVCLARYVLPALYQAMGLRERAHVSALRSQRRSNSRRRSLRFCRLQWSTTTGAGRGRCRSRPTVPVISRSLAGTDGFVELPPGPNVWPKGFVTRIYRW